MKPFLYLTIPLLAASAALQSCTVSEPKQEDGNPSQLRLSHITSYGVTVMNCEYDAANRITLIQYGTETRWEFYYSDPNSRVPSSIINYEYGEEYLNDVTQKVLKEKNEIHDIKGNANGCITSYKDKETQYLYYTNFDENGQQVVVDEVRVTTGYGSYEYNSAGQLVKDVYTDNSNRYTTVTTYEWQNGDLVKTYDNDTDHREVTEMEYSDTVNTTGQWDPHNPVFGPMGITGLHGKAPLHYMKASRYFNSNQLNESYQYSYNLLPNGLINLEQLAETDSQTNQLLDRAMLKYVYTKIK